MTTENRYFVVMVDTNNGKQTSMTGYTDTLKSAITDGISMSSYYYFFCGYRNPTFTIESRCATCNGNGRVRSKRGLNTKKCTTCKGKDSAVTVVEDVAFMLHENIRGELDKVTL